MFAFAVYGRRPTTTGYVLHVPTFTQHHDAHDGVNRVEGIVNALYRLPSRLKSFLLTSPDLSV